MNVPGSEALVKAMEDFRKVQGSALIAGGMAVVYHGYERSTKDVDALYATVDEAQIVKRMKPDFKIVLKAKNGWHHFTHRKTGVRLELIPEGGLTTYGFIPGPKTVGGEDGFISLHGLIWLKLVSGRAQDIADLITLAKLKLNEFIAQREKLPPELHVRFDELITQARKEIANDPNRGGNEPDRAREQPARYSSRKRQKTKRKN